MPHFSRTSRARLASCHPRLAEVCEVVVVNFDIKILEGWRSPERQDELFAEGRSKVRAGQSRHNHTGANGQPLSLAVDVIPYPFAPEDWEDTRRFYVMAGHVQAAAAGLSVAIRWGGDWDGDGSFRDQSFHDLPHFELSL